MGSWLENPAVQGGVAPLVVGLVVALALNPLRLGGLALPAAFVTAMYFVSGLRLTPLTATRKILILAAAAPLFGILVDFAFRPTRLGSALLAAAAALAALWVCGPVLAQKEAWLVAAALALSAAFAVGFMQLYVASDGIRAGSAALGLGLGAGVGAILGASATYGLYGIAIGAGAGGFLLPQMIGGRKQHAGAVLALPAALLGMLVAAGAVVLAQLPWYCAAVLALTPLAARLPVPERSPAWLAAVLTSFYALVVAAAACFLAWQASRG